MTLAPGLRSVVRIVVADTDTAAALGSGDVPVLGTPRPPRLLALAEAAAAAAVRPGLEPGQTSVGTSVVLEHQRPSPPGAEVAVEAELTEVDGRRLVFGFTARHARHPGSPDDQQVVAGPVVVGTGTMERMIVDRDRFVSRAQHE